MFPEKMNKYAVRKEIAALIDSIKSHSDSIGTRKQIPQIELELILHKIEKLYQKSIVFNYLNSIDGGQGVELSEPELPVADNKNLVFNQPATPVSVAPVKPESVTAGFNSESLVTGLDEIANLIAGYDQKPVTPEIITPPVPEVKPEPVIEIKPEPVIEKKPEPVIEIKPEPVAEKKPEPVVEIKPEPVIEKKPEPVVEIKPEPVIEKKPEPVIVPPVKTTPPPPVVNNTKTYPPVKSLMGFNDKIMFARSLFGNDQAVFEEALKQIDGCSTFEEAAAFVSVLKTEMKWKPGDEIAESFLQLIRRRFS